MRQKIAGNRAATRFFAHWGRAKFALPPKYRRLERRGGKTALRRGSRITAIASGFPFTAPSRVALLGTVRRCADGKQWTQCGNVDDFFIGPVQGR